MMFATTDTTYGEIMLNRTMLSRMCSIALSEDMGKGDATTDSIVPEGIEVTASVITREQCVCAGLPVVEAVFRELDPEVYFECLAQEGELCEPGRLLARITGDARALLSGERTALNFLQRLCGIATAARRYTRETENTKTEILDTRKTTPGLRVLEKYAVRAGGARNHRMGLFDRIMIKDNHRELSAQQGPDAIIRAVEACRNAHPELEIEVEADTLDHVEEALDAEADYILLDNMSDDEIAAAVSLNGGRALLEASGGITLERVSRLAALGVDFISVGALTHSFRAIDIGLDLDIQ